MSPLVAALLLAAPPDADATRHVVAAVTAAAKANARADRPLAGDALTDHYVRAAAAAARTLPEAQRGAAFAAALGVALDDSSVLRGNPLFGRFCRACETAEERKARLAVLGKPTVRGQRDKCQHFAVSCALTALAGREAAEAAGLLKEQLDTRPGGSGFSFADLAADFAGVAFAARVLDGTTPLDALARFAVSDFVTPFDGLDDGLDAAAFAKKFGSFDDDRFKAEVARVRRLVAAAPGLR